ncbi:hypothetical protein ARMGADRAFT_1033834 [Armillaria gallica]|uniref:Uncharacterized protein n=1 Tax=Armillaria gallica TaxID=47427 RepID=A0A2H3D0Q3_ARMGA|nr:hypothetical protein ARMGADRAFT_1033834 [Armillaria gallica]
MLEHYMLSTDHWTIPGDLVGRTVFKPHKDRGSFEVVWSVPDSLKIENSITFPDHSTSLLSHNKSWRYLQEIWTRHKHTQVELMQTQMNTVERTHAGVKHRILLAHCQEIDIFW